MNTASVGGRKLAVILAATMVFNSLYAPAVMASEDDFVDFEVVEEYEEEAGDEFAAEEESFVEFEDEEFEDFDVEEAADFEDEEVFEDIEVEEAVEEEAEELAADANAGTYTVVTADGEKTASTLAEAISMVNNNKTITAGDDVIIDTNVAFDVDYGFTLDLTKATIKEGVTIKKKENSSCLVVSGKVYTYHGSHVWEKAGATQQSLNDDATSVYAWMSVPNIVLYCKYDESHTGIYAPATTATAVTVSIPEAYYELYDAVATAGGNITTFNTTYGTAWTAISNPSTGVYTATAAKESDAFFGMVVEESDGTPRVTNGNYTFTYTMQSGDLLGKSVEWSVPVDGNNDAYALALTYPKYRTYSKEDAASPKQKLAILDTNGMPRVYTRYTYKGSLVTDNDGEPVEIYGTVTDVRDSYVDSNSVTHNRTKATFTKYGSHFYDVEFEMPDEKVIKVTNLEVYDEPFTEEEAVAVAGIEFAFKNDDGDVKWRSWYNAVTVAGTDYPYSYSVADLVTDITFTVNDYNEPVYDNTTNKGYKLLDKDGNLT